MTNNQHTFSQQDMADSETTTMFAIRAIEEVSDAEVDRWAAQAFMMIRIHAGRRASRYRRQGRRYP